MEFKHPVSTSIKSVGIAQSLPDARSAWLVWSYCGLYKNLQAESQPLVLVAFRKWTEGWVDDEVELRRVPLTMLGLLQIGTLWRAQTRIGKTRFDVASFPVSFDQDDWWFSSFSRQAGPNGEPPYPCELYPLHIRADQNQHLVLRLGYSDRLVIPCLEFYFRLYGRSVEIKRVLATYPWSDQEGGSENRLFGEPPAARPDGRWVVNVQTRLRDDDAVFLAHTKYDRYCRNAAKSIYAQIEALHDSQRLTPAFIKVAPWFRGQARIKVEGLWFNDRQSFLGLRVLGCSDPQGNRIYATRTNSNRTEMPAPQEDADSAWAGRSRQRDIQSVDPLTLTGDCEPDHDAASVEVEDEGFEVLGTPRNVEFLVRPQAATSSGPKGYGREAESYSSGEAHGKDRNVGYASIHAPVVLESHGTLRDMWNAVQFLHFTEPAYISTVESYSFSGGYSADPEPLGIAFRNQDQDNTGQIDVSYPNQVRNWQYLDRVNQVVRGLLVIRLKSRGRSVHIVEIQRRTRNSRTGGAYQQSEESFRGLVFMLNDDDLLPEWLSGFLTQASFKKGVIESLTSTVPGVAAVFKHTQAAGDRIPCEAAVINALRKMGIERSEVKLNIL